MFQVDVLRHSAERVSSSAEVYGAVQQEARSADIQRCHKMCDQLFTPLETVYIGCPKQALVLARSGDHGDYENIFLEKLCWPFRSYTVKGCVILYFQNQGCEKYTQYFL